MVLDNHHEVAVDCTARNLNAQAIEGIPAGIILVVSRFAKVGIAPDQNPLFDSLSSGMGGNACG